MQTMSKLLYLIDGDALRWRINLAASAVLAKVVLYLPVGAISCGILDTREYLKSMASSV